MTKITKLRCAAKSAYCDEVVNFLDILKDRDVSEQIVNIPEDEAQLYIRFRLIIIMLLNNCVCEAEAYPGMSREGGGGGHFIFFIRGEVFQSGYWYHNFMF